MGEDLCQCQLRSVCFENKTLGTEMRLALSVVLLVCAAADRGSRYTECKDCVASSSEMYGCDIYTGNCDSFLLENESECWYDGFCYASDTADCCKIKTGAAVMLITIPLLILIGGICCCCFCCPSCPIAKHRQAKKWEEAAHCQQPQPVIMGAPTHGQFPAAQGQYPQGQPQYPQGQPQYPQGQPQYQGPPQQSQFPQQAQPHYTVPPQYAPPPIEKSLSVGVPMSAQ